MIGAVPAHLCAPIKIYRGPANGSVEPPGWASYLILIDVEGKKITMPPGGLDQVPVLETDGGILRFYWSVGQVLPMNGGCGYGEVLYFGGSQDELLEIHATRCRSEAYEDSPRLR